MAIKPRFNDSAQEKVSDRLDKQLARVYLIWLVGIIVGAIQLRPEKVEYAGISYVIDSPERLQGIIFVGCVIYYLAIVANIILHGLQNVTTDRALKRRYIYAALGKKRTLLGIDPSAIYLIRLNARLLYATAMTILFFVAFLPLLHVLLFQQQTFLVGIDAIFHTTSIKDGHVNLDAPATILLTLLLMVVWTALVKWVSRKAFGPKVELTIFVNGLALLTFAFLDSRLRGQELYSQALPRDFALQITIVAIAFVPTAIVWPFQLWFRVQLVPVLVRLAYVKWKLRKAQQKGQKGP
jgi:hypothetical protein